MRERSACDPVTTDSFTQNDEMVTAARAIGQIYRHYQTPALRSTNVEKGEDIVCAIGNDG